MPPSRKKDVRIAVLVAAIVAAGGLVPLAYQYGERHHPATQVAGGPAPAAAPVPAPPAGTGVDTAPAAPTPPGTEVVPPDESETPEPARPTESFGHLAGLHQSPDPMHLSAGAAIAMDADTGQVLAHKNEQAVLPIASLTKLMTTLLVLQAKQPMDEVLTITEDDVDHERHSRSRLRVGTQLTREEALHLALMSSENRAAHALGRTYPGGLPKLVEAMNAKAQQLGMKHTTYVEPTGLSNHNQSTAEDLALLVREAARNPVMRDFTTTPAHLASLGGKVLQFHNSDSLVRSNSGRWDIGLQKTGYIVEAGRCLVLYTKVAGHDLVMVLLDSDSNGTRVHDAERLRQYVVAQNGWQDVTVARASAQHVMGAAAQEKPQHAGHHAAHHKGHAAGEHAVAKRESKQAKEEVAAKRELKPAKEEALARTKPHGKHAATAHAAKDAGDSKEATNASASAHAGKHRVHQSFAAEHPHEKS
jgi:serine-type D-Ala-D-Ala endopeptidase (penicillin-binding protein 7)